MRNPDIRHRIDADAILGERPGPGDDPRDAALRSAEDIIRKAMDACQDNLRMWQYKNEPALGEVYWASKAWLEQHAIGGTQ